MPKYTITLCVILALLAGAIPTRAQEATQPLVHVVQPGENLYRIALNYGLTVDALMAANGLSAPDLVVVGQTLIIPAHWAASVPAASATGPAAAGVRQHVVQPGESLLQIARQYGITLDTLITANAIANPSLIMVGQVLVIPGNPSTGQPDDSSPMELDLPAGPENDADAPLLQGPTLTTPDLGILPTGDAAGEVASTDASEVAAPVAALAAPDLGIISPASATWIVQPGILTLGGPNTRAIYERGQTLGNDPHAFSKIGDCNSETPFFLAKFDKGEYNLGEYAYLQPVIDHFAGSFVRESAAVWTGNHAWALFDPVWANPAICQPGETPLACEFRIQRPSLVLIRLGTNEAGSPDLFETNLRLIIEFSIERGVIPVLGTKADRIEGSDANNAIIRRLAAEYEVPLWDFGRVADTLPMRGLLVDGFHLSYAPPDYTTPLALQTGHSVQNLLALMALNTVWRNAMY